MEWIDLRKELPNNGQIVDVWYVEKRRTSYRFIKNYKDKIGNNFFEPISGGLSCIRPIQDVSDNFGATHWMSEPLPPNNE